MMNSMMRWCVEDVLDGGMKFSDDSSVNPKLIDDVDLLVKYE